MKNKYLLLFLLSFLFLIPFKTNAATIQNGLYGISNISTNGTTFFNQTFLSSSTPFPIAIQSGIGNNSQFILKNISMSSYIPVPKTGISWSSDMTFLFSIQNGYFTSLNCSGIVGSVVPEQGVKISSSSTVTGCTISADGHQMQVKVSSIGTLQSSVNMTSLAFGINNPSNYLYSCNDSPGAMVQVCNPNLKITAQSVDVNFTITEDPNTALLGGIKQEQQQTNKKLDELQKSQEQTNKELKETNDFLKDDTKPSSDISVLGNVQGLLPAGPIDSLLNIPFEFLSVLTSSMSGTCVPLQGKFVYDSTLTIPCFSEIVYDEVPEPLMNFISLIPGAFILIKYFKHLYKKVDRAVSMETTGDDEWGAI